MKKKVKWILAAVVFIALGCWMKSRWRAWFSIPDEPAYTVGTSPTRVLLTPGSDDPLTRNISWMCDTIVREAWVEIEGLPHVGATGEVFRSRSGQAAFYVARLRQLKPATTYRYRVCTGGEYSPWYSFRTQAADAKRFTFIYVGDVQDSIGGQANRFLREAFVRHPEAELLVCGGDLTERPSDNYWGETFRDIDSLCTALPVMTVTGNHDYLKTVPMKLERRFSLVFSYFLDSMVGENQLYNLRWGQAEFFLLDSNREPNYLWTQRQWLDERLSNSLARWKIVVLHHPLYSLKGTAHNAVQRWMFDDIIRRHHVDLVLEGHEHQYGRMAARNERGQATTPLYIVSHCSPKHYSIDPGDRFDRIDRDSRYYQVIDVTTDTLTLRTYDVYEHQQRDMVRITHVRGATDSHPAVAQKLPDGPSDFLYLHEGHINTPDRR